MNKLPKLSKLLLLLILGAVVLIPFLVRPKKTAFKPRFSRSILGNSYQGKVPGIMETSLSANKEGGQIEVSRNQSTLSLTLPLPQAKLEKQKEELVYSTPEKAVEVRYQLLANGLKEELVLLQKPASNQFEIELNTKNLKVKMNAEGLPVFFDAKTGRYLFHFEKPFIKDSQGQETSAVKYTLKPKSASDKGLLSPFPEKELTPQDKTYRQGGRTVTQKNLLSPLVPAGEDTAYILTTTIDENWLYDPKRVYPLILDPTVVYDTGTEFAAGTLNRLQNTGASDNSPSLESFYQELPADNNTVALWHMNETANDTCSGGEDVCDFSGNGYDGTVTGTTIETTDQKLGAADRSFNGTSDYISLGTSLNSITTLPVTIEAWIKINSQTGSPMIVQQNESATNYYGFRFGLAGIYQLDLAYGSGGAIGPTSRRSYSTPANTLTTGRWYHVAGVIRGPTDMSIYVDGVGVGGTYAGTGGAMSVSGNGNIGRGVFAATSYFDGIIDEVRVSNTARTAEEIKADAQRRPYATYTSDVIDLAKAQSWNSLSWTEVGVSTGDGEGIGSTANLAAQWNFNEASGTTAAIYAGSCGTACNGALKNFLNTSSRDVGGSYASGWTANNKRWGAGALMLDGVNDYVSVPHNSALDIATSFTTEAWIKTSATGVYGNILYKDEGSKVLELYSNGTILFSLYTSIGNAVNSKKTVNDGQWHYVAATYDGTNEKVYIDGALDNTLATSGDVTDTGFPLTIGAAFLSGAYSNYFPGVIDSIRWYTRTLSASEILANYNAGNIEMQTRVGNSADANDGTWEAWKPTTGETQIQSLDSDQGNWYWDLTDTGVSGSTADYMQKAKADNSTVKVEGSGSLSVSVGIAQTAPDVIGLWHFDETGSGVGTTFYDASGNGNHGVGSTMPSLVEGFAGKARNFDGTNDFVTVKDNLGLGATFMTVEAWVYPKGFTSGAPIYNRRSAANVGGVTLELNGTGGLVSCYFYVTGSWRSVTSGSALTLNKWNHLGCSYDGATIRLFLNGALDTTTSISGSINNPASPIIEIGRNISSGSLKWNGYIDDLKVYKTAKTSIYMAESYRAGRDHRLTRTINSTDLSNKKEMPFYVASDRPGTFLEASIGESAYANYETDANMVGLWHLEEGAGIGGSGPTTTGWFKDSSSNANNGTAVGISIPSEGKIGEARKFNGVSDYITVADHASLDLSTFTVDLWVYLERCNFATYQGIVGKGTGDIANRNYALFVAANTCNIHYSFGNGTSWASHNSSTTLAVNRWYHLAYTFGSGTSKFYINGVLDSSYTEGITPTTNAEAFTIGTVADYTGFDGSIDEVRVSNSVRTADEIRQAYEIGKRSHQITIDFKAKLIGNLISNSGDTDFTIDATAYGAQNQGDNLYIGDKIIIEENVSGTNYFAQGTVKSVDHSTGAVVIESWDNGSTFPPSGYTANAIVFKWQREYFDITGSLDTQRDEIGRITLRFTDGSQGTNVWLDDWRYLDNYLTTNTGSTITSGTGYRYFQYRTTFSGNDKAVSPALTSATLDYVQNSAPNTPSLDSPADGATKQTLTPSLKTTATDTDSDFLKYKIELCTNSGMTQGCQTFDQTISQTGWNAGVGGTYPSGNQATYTVQTPLSNDTTYYWRSYAIDPVGRNLWGSTQAAPFSFLTNRSPDAPTLPWCEGQTNPTNVSTATPTFSAVHNDADGDSANYYQVQVGTDADWGTAEMWDSGQAAMTTTADATRSPEITYAGSGLNLNSTTYYWRIRFWDVNGATGAWSTTQYFTTIGLVAPGNCLLAKDPLNSQILVKWSDTNVLEDSYQVDKRTDLTWSATPYTTTAASVTSYLDATGISSGHTYQYRIRAKLNDTTSDWCYTPSLDLEIGSLKFEGVKLEGIQIQ